MSRLGQSRIVEDVSKDSLEFVTQRIADVRAQAAFTGKGECKGSDEPL